MRDNRFPIGLRTALAIFAAILFATSGWAELHDAVLHNFNHNGTDGTYPQAGVVVDGGGNVYGATNNGGTFGYGTAY